MRRVRVGALGLACVFLLVMLATTFLRAGGDAGLGNGGDGAANFTEPADPLATLGVAPGNPPASVPPAAPPAARPR